MRRISATAVLLLVVTALAAGCATLGVLQSIETLLTQARELLDAKRFDEALTKLTEVIRRDAAQWRAYLYAAQAYIGKVDWTSALTSARKALELAPGETTVAATLGDALFGGGLDALKRGAFGNAASLFVEYVKLRPADAAGYLNAGRAYLGNRSWTEATRLLVEGMGRADPAARQDFVRTLLEGGRQAITAGDHRGAIGLLREYVRQEPTDVSAYLELGKSYWNTGDRSDALAAFRRVLELAPQNEEARRLLFGR